MKKLFLLLIFVALSFTLIACGDVVDDPDTGSGDYLVLPDLNGKTDEEIIKIFDDYGQEFTLSEFDQESEIYQNEFIMYVNFDTGDIVNKSDEVEILVYPDFTGIRTFIYLPDLKGLDQDQIIDYFDMYELNVSFSDTFTDVTSLDGVFSHYGSFYEPGDMFALTSNVSVVVYALDGPMDDYYFPIDMVYDGPLLRDVYETIDPIDPRGGYFDVDLYYCSDGDTAVFDYPTDVYNAIISRAKSTRFLNMDTEETFSGGEEEWGKSGSVYTCSLLESADSIILQTDPGDALTGTYGRLLAWVWVKLPGETDYFLLNYMVVKQGLAQVKYEFGAGLDLSYGDYTYNEWMHIAEDYAKINDLGQWGDQLDYYWDYENEQPFYSRWN